MWVVTKTKVHFDQHKSRDGRSSTWQGSNADICVPLVTSWTMSTDESETRSLLGLMVSMLKERISADPVEGGPSVSVDSTESPVRLAVESALYEVAWTSGASGFGEEHQTASFMGHLASSLTWYAIAWAYSQDEDTDLCLPEIYWSGHSKNPGKDKNSSTYKSSEPQTGMDFGIIARDPVGEVYRIALFQAKLAEVKEADNDAEDGADRKFSIYGHKPGYRQIESMLRTQSLGNKSSYGRDPSSWCHFAVWHSEDLRYPQRVCLDRVLRKDPIKNRIRAAELRKNDKPLSEVIIDTIIGTITHEKYLTIAVGLVPEFLDQIVELMPRIQLLAVDESGSGEMGETLDKSKLRFNPQSATALNGAVIRRDGGIGPRP